MRPYFVLNVCERRAGPQSSRRRLGLTLAPAFHRGSWRRAWAPLAISFHMLPLALLLAFTTSSSPPAGRAPAPAPAAPAAAEARSANNLVQNPSFGDLSGWRVPAAYTRVSNVTQAPAKHALMYSNDDPKKYELATQAVVAAVPGHAYVLSASVKTALTSQYPGEATACVQWEKHGTWGGGEFPKGFAGTSSGWEVVTTKFVFPADADPGSLTVSVYVRGPQGGKDPTPLGLAYFDNVSLVRRSHLFEEVFLYKDDHFAKTGSGRT